MKALDQRERFSDQGRDKHSISHHRGNKDDIELLAQMDIVQSEKIAAFAKRLNETIDIDGSPMLDNVVLFIGSGMQDARSLSTIRAYVGPRDFDENIYCNRPCI